MNVFKSSDEKVKESSLQQFSVQTWNGNGYNELIKNNLTKSGKQIDTTGFTEMHTKHENAVLKGNMLLSGCGDINDPFAGVGLLLSEKAENALVYASAISSHILMARFSGRSTNTTVIIAFIPHRGHKQDNFQQTTYDLLERTIAAVSEHDCLIVMGDFNAV